MIPTEDRQQVRTRLGVNLVVEAGAGTGKTTLLIERLCYALLAQGILAPRLVALTFTEKAAAEIKTRLLFKLQSIVQAIREKKEEPVLAILRTHFGVPEADILSRAELALTQLDRSQIGTIHGFCADILRTFPLEAGLTPNAEIDKGARARRILDTLWNRFLDEQLGEHAPQPEVWKIILSKASLTDLYECVQELCSGKIQQYDYFAQKERLIHVCQEQAQKAHGLAAAYLPPKKKPRVIEQALQQAAQRFEQAATWLQTGALPPKEEETIEVKSVPKDWDPISAEQAKALCRFAAQADPWVQTWVLQVQRVLQEVVAQVRERYAAEGILSFDDLIVKTRDLLQQNLLVRRLLQEKYDALYIDEFQDTDPVQGELLLFLAEQKGNGARTWQEVKLEPGKLFVVGDPKQSIYRFRGADITAYQLFTDLILKQGGIKAYLRQNFRSEREIIALANQVCGTVMVEKPAFQPAYEPIFTRKEEISGAAEMALIQTPEQKALADDYRHNQAEFVARWIEEHVGRMTLRNGRKLAYQDIAILSRAATTLTPYTDALRRHGIAFSVEEDRDFYHRPEVADFLNLLRVLEDPQDRISLVGVMRGPLGALTDEEVYQAARRGDWDYRKPAAEPKLERLFELLRNLSARVGRQPLNQLLRAVLQETFLPQACAYAYDGERSMANLQRLVSLAEGYSQQTPTTLGQFLARIEELMEQELGRLTAQPETESARTVNVMTIHKSKGLEFPVVIWVDVSKKETASAAKRPAHLYSWNLNVHGLRIGKYADLNLAWLEEEQREHARCEEIRVVYVALTRAREKLLIVGNAQSDSACAAALFARAGLFPAPEETPAALGPSRELSLHYVPYQDPEKFIYTHHIANQSYTAQVEIKEWRQLQEKRLQAYREYKQQAAVLAPSKQVSADVQDEQAARVGSLVHTVLAKRWKNPQYTVTDAAASLKEPVSACEQARAAELVNAFYGSPVYEQLSNMQVLGVEIPFSQQTSQGIISGVIDLLLQDKTGTVWVVDYKTDQVTAGQEEQAARVYQPQLTLYQAAAQALYPQATVHKAVVFIRTAQWVLLD